MYTKAIKEPQNGITVPTVYSILSKRTGEGTRQCHSLEVYFFLKLYTKILRVIMNGQLSSGLCPFPQTQHIHPCPKSKTYLSISPPPAIFLNQNSSSFYTENYCLMLTGMRYRRFASTDSNGPLCST